MDNFDKNKKWAGSWGHPMDPRSCPIVKMTRAELEEIRSASTTLPVGAFALAGITNGIRESMSEFWELRDALNKGKLDELIANDEQLENSKLLTKPVLTTPDEDDHIDLNDPSLDENENWDIDKCFCGFSRVSVMTRNGRSAIVCLNADCTSHQKG